MHANQLALSQLSLTAPSLMMTSQRFHGGRFIVCFHFLSWSTSHSFPPKKNYFFLIISTFPPRAVRLSATLAPASCSAEHPSIPFPGKLQLGRGLELLSEGADSAAFLPAPVLTGVKLPPGPRERARLGEKERNKQAEELFSGHFVGSHSASTFGFWTNFQDTDF